MNFEYNYIINKIKVHFYKKVSKIVIIQSIYNNFIDEIFHI